MKTDIDIAKAAKIEHISKIAQKLNIQEDDLDSCSVR